MDWHNTHPPKKPTKKCVISTQYAGFNVQKSQKRHVFPENYFAKFQANPSLDLKFPPTKSEFT